MMYSVHSALYMHKILHSYRTDTTWRLKCLHSFSISWEKFSGTLKANISDAWMTIKNLLLELVAQIMFLAVLKNEAFSYVLKGVRIVELPLECLLLTLQSTLYAIRFCFSSFLWEFIKINVWCWTSFRKV